MCGIVGFTREGNNLDLLKKMNKEQTHRGPDDEGYFICNKNNVHLAMRRLSILDLDNGHQPMEIHDGKIYIVYNCEIFNSPELRLGLESKGIKFKTKNSDTEVILHLYAKYGVKTFSMLNGMFALTIFDSYKNIIISARDHVGIKPFFYSINNNDFNFSSEIKSLLKLPWITKKINNQSVYHFFSFQFIPPPETIYEEIKKLPAGHYIEWNLETRKEKIIKYWNPKFLNKTPCKNYELNEYIHDEIKKAVSRWSLSDVPVACSLSSGIDSSTIVALLANQSRNQLKTFTLGFNDELELDERKLAKKLSDKYNTDHTEIVINSSDLIKNIDEMLKSLDEPYAGGLPSWFVFKEMSNHVKVAMTGTGADELFGNYGKWYPYSRPSHFIRSSARYLFRKGGSIKDYLTNPKGCLYHPLYFSGNIKKKNIFNSTFLKIINEESEQYISQNLMDINLNSKNAITSLDLSLQLPEEFLFMTDRFSMSHSLEARTPFLDKDLIESILNIPFEKRVEFNDLKKFFRNSVKRYLPDSILESKKKGFVLPVDKWLKKDLRNELIQYSENNFLKNQNIFQANLKDNFIKPFLNNKTNNSDQIWNWWIFQRWWILNNSIEII